MDDKIVKVIFKEGWETMYNNDLTQGDFGQILQIEGLTLPDGNVEVHFSLTEYNGEAPISIGTVKDNTITVDIPDFILAKENTYNSSYEAYAWIYVTDGESGRTIRKIVFTVDTRATPTTNVPEANKDQFLQEVRQVLTETKEVAQSVRDDADNGKFNGPQGDPGKDGKSAYQYAVEGGYTGTEAEFMESLARAGDVITKEEHEAELLKAMVKVTTEESAFHYITDSANMKVVDFGMRGITEQNSVPGNQLFDLASSNGFVSLYTGLSTEIDLENNTLTTTNSHTSNRTGHLDLGVLDAGTYFISYTNVNGYTTLPRVCTGELESGLTTVISIINDGSGFTLEKLAHCWFVWVVETGNPLKIANFMLNKGSTAIPIEPYVGGQPSPNPSHPQEIELAGVLNEETGRYEHKHVIVNENYADISSLINGVYIKPETGEEASNKDQTSSDFILLQTEHPIIVYSGDVTYKKICFYDSDKNFISGTGVGSGYLRAYIPSGTRYIRYCFATVNDINSANICIETTNNNQYTGVYTPHASQSFTLTSDRPLTKWDNLVKVDGKWYWDYKQLHLSVDGNETITADDERLGFRFNSITLQGKWNKRDGYCNQLRVTQEYITTQNGLCLGMVNTLMYAANNSFYDETLEDYGLANFKAHLNEHPLEIYTYKDESELVPLLDEEQELLHNLETYYGVTNVWNEQGCPIKITYAADQELHWNQKLLQIQQAMI